MPDEIAGLWVRGQFHLELPKRFLIGNSEQFLGKGFQFNEVNGYRA